MIYARPNETIEPLLVGAPTGLVGTLSVRIVMGPPGTQTLVSSTTAGIVEVADGAYVASVELPNTSGDFLVIWDDGTREVVEELQVRGGIVSAFTEPSGTLTYASIEAFRSYAPEYAALDDDEITSLLLTAEIDVDATVGPRSISDVGRKFVPTSLSLHNATQLQRATCAQAQYRKLMGPRFFATGQHTEVQGPDFKTVGKLPTFGPQAWRELQNSHLLTMTTTWGGHSDSPPWSDFAIG